MKEQFLRENIGDGVHFSVITDSKFKSNRLTINFIVPLARETVTGYALLPWLLRKGHRDEGGYMGLNRKLDNLYGSSLMTGVESVGGHQIVSLTMQSLDDRYAMKGEELLKQSAELLLHLAFEPDIKDGSFDEEHFKLESRFLHDTITAEINDKISYAYFSMKKEMWGDHPLALRKYGYTEDLADMTAKSAADFYYSLLENATIEIMLTGPAKSDAIKQTLKDMLAKVKRSPKPMAKVELPPMRNGVNNVVREMDIVQAKLSMGFRVPPQTDRKAITAMKVANLVYGGSVASKLFLNVRERLSLCYYCSSQYDRLSGMLSVNSGVELAKVEEAKQEILHQLSLLKEGDITEEELTAAKLKMKNSLRGVSDSTGALESWYIVQIISGEITAPTGEFELIDSLTADDIKQAAKEISVDTIFLLSPETADIQD